MEISFKNKRALVTGASKGIGREIAIKLSECGAEVIAMARSDTLLDSLHEENPNITTISIDLSNWKLVESIFNSLCPLDFLINNAGVAIYESLLETTQDNYEKLFNINVGASILLTKLFVKNIIDHGKPSGVIVNVSSLASLVGVDNFSIYSASKGALDAFTRSVAKEYGKYNIRANSVNPTVIKTEMGAWCLDNPENKKSFIDSTPLKRLGEISDVVDAVLFLLSDKAKMITGISLPIDGGYAAV